MKKLLLIALILFTTLVYSQKPKVSAVRYTEVTTTERDNYSVPVGEFWRIYNTTTTQNEYWDGDSWEPLSISEATFNLNSKNYSWGESYIENWGKSVLDLGATYFPNNGGYEKGRLHELGLIPSLHFIPAAVGEGVIYSIGKNRTNDLDVSNSASTYVDEDGIIQTAPIDFARIDYTDGDGAFLVEPQSINLYLNSEVMVTQDVTVAASEYTVSFYGTGTITFTGTHTGSLVGTGLNDLVSITFTPSAGTLTSTISSTVTHGQIELDKYASSRIITAGTTVTRLADVIRGAGDVNTFSSINSSGVFYAEIAALVNAEGTTRPIALSDGSASNRLRIYFFSGGGLRAGITVSGTSTTIVTSTTGDADFVKIALRYDADFITVYVDGNLIETKENAAGVAFPLNTLDEFSFSYFGTSSPFYGKIKQLKALPYLTDEEMILLTKMFGFMFLCRIRRKETEYKIAA